MFQIIMDNPLRFILALVIGIATAWWIWGRLSASGSTASQESTSQAAPKAGAAPTPAPKPAPAPAPKPVVEPEAVAPVAAAGAALAAASDGDEDKPKIAAAVGESDDLTRIKGVGPKLNDLCLSLGVRRFDQIAQWSDADVAEVDQYLKIKGRITRDRWVDQAKLLATGDDAGHKAEFG